MMGPKGQVLVGVCGLAVDRSAKLCHHLPYTAAHPGMLAAHPFPFPL